MTLPSDALGNNLPDQTVVLISGPRLEAGIVDTTNPLLQNLTSFVYASYPAVLQSGLVQSSGPVAVGNIVENILQQDMSAFVFNSAFFGTVYTLVKVPFNNSELNAVADQPQELDDRGLTVFPFVVVDRATNNVGEIRTFMNYSEPEGGAGSGTGGGDQFEDLDVDYSTLQLWG